MFFGVENRVEVGLALVGDDVVDAGVALAAAAFGGVDLLDGGGGADVELVGADADDVAVFLVEGGVFVVHAAVAVGVRAVELGDFGGEGSGEVAEAVEEEAVDGHAGEEG